MLHNSEPIPFGATVTRDDEGTGSIVGEAGQVYLSGLAPKGKLKVQWGEGADQACSVDYQLPVDAEKAAITQMNVICR